MLAVKIVLGLLALLAVISFAAMNQVQVELFYYFGYQYETRLWVAVLLPLAAGVVLTSIILSYYIFKEKSAAWMLSRQVSKLEDEVKNLKQRPLPDMPGVYPAPMEDIHPELVQAQETRALPGNTAPM